MTPTERIQMALDGIAQAHGIKILYAVESGSRAWGFNSPDSDYDVRFIYQQDGSRYLDLFGFTEQIEHLSGDLDIVGWDLSKALFLFRKSNCSLIEWMHSPIVYRSPAAPIHAMADLLPSVNLAALRCHYIGLAKSHYRKYVDVASPKAKKYLYVVRGLECAAWIENNQSIPPVDMAELFTWPKVVEDLVQKKRSGLETSETGRIPMLDKYITGELDKPMPYCPAPEIQKEDLNKIWLNALENA